MTLQVLITISNMVYYFLVQSPVIATSAPTTAVALTAAAPTTAVALTAAARTVKTSNVRAADEVFVVLLIVI